VQDEVKQELSKCEFDKSSLDGKDIDSRVREGIERSEARETFFDRAQRPSVQRCNVQSTSTAPPYDVPNPYSVPGCTCLADKSPELFRGKAQSTLSLGTIYLGTETRLRTSRRAYEAREEKFAPIPIYTSRLAAEKARVFSLSCDSGIALTDIVNAGIINVQH